jgi:hypothetical protein
MIARLPDELISELERAGDEPLRVENPRNHKLYVIVPESGSPIVIEEDRPLTELGQQTITRAALRSSTSKLLARSPRRSPLSCNAWSNTSMLIWGR